MTAAASHNGGRSTVNFSDLTYGSEFPFINLLKGAQKWVVFGGSGAGTIVDPRTLDSNGYPTSLAELGYIMEVYVPTQQVRPGRYVLDWVGNGTVIVFGFAFTYHTGFSSADLTSTTGSGRVEFLPTGNIPKFNAIGIGAIGTPRITSMRLYHIDDEAAQAAGGIFGKKLKERLVESNPGVFRFLSWPDNNKTNMTTWRTRKPVDYAWYAGDEVRGASFCDPASNGLTGKTYTFAAPSQDASTGAAFALADKAFVHVKFTNACPVSTFTGTMTNSSDTIAATAHGRVLHEQVWTDSARFGNSYVPMFVVSVPSANALKLGLTQGGAPIVANSAGAIDISPAIYANVGGTGAKIIRSEYGNGISTGGNAYPQIDYSALASLIFDADLDSWIKHGGAHGSGSLGIVNGVPPEIQVQLCAEMGAHPHLLMPVLGMDPQTDYVTSLATYCRDNGPAWMVPSFEPPNELWNTYTGFYNGFIGGVKANAHWGVFDYHNFYGKIASTMGQAISAVYSANRAKYRMLCGVQTGVGNTLGGTAAMDQRLNSGEYFSQSAAAQSPYTKSRAKDWVTHVAVANYFAPSDMDTPTEAADIAAFAACEVTASINAGAVVVSSVAFGSLAVGKKFFGGDGIPNGGLTITAGSHPNWTVTPAATIGAERLIAGNFSGGQTAAYAATVASGSGPFTIAANLTFYQNWKTWAQGFGIQKMCGYEGGYSANFYGGTSVEQTNAADQFKAATKLETYVQTATLDNYNNFVGLTGGGFVAEFPASYYGGTSPCSAVWPVIDDIFTLQTQPGFEALKTFNAVGSPPPGPVVPTIARSLRLRLGL